MKKVFSVILVVTIVMSMAFSIVSATSDIEEPKSVPAPIVETV